MAGTLKPTKQSELLLGSCSHFEFVVVEVGRALCTNLPSYHLRKHFSVCMLYFNRKFPPKLICGLWEASSGWGAEGHKWGHPSLPNTAVSVSAWSTGVSFPSKYWTWHPQNLPSACGMTWLPHLDPVWCPQSSPSPYDAARLPHLGSVWCQPAWLPCYQLLDYERD